VATHARCDGISSDTFTANLSRNLRRENFENRLRFDRIMAMSLCSHFLVHHAYCKMCKIETMLLQNTYSKWYTACRITAIPVSFSDYQGHWKIAVASLSVNKISTDTAYSFSRYVVAEPLVILQICYLWRTEYMQCAHLYSQYIPAVFYLPVLLNDIVLQWFDTLMSTEFDVFLFFRLCSWQRRQRYFRIYWSVLRVKMLLTVVNRLCFYLLFIT